VRILGEHKRGNYITQYQIKKIPNFWEFEKNLVPPMLFSKIKNVWAMMWGDVWGMIKRCVGIVWGKMKWGDVFKNCTCR
jgi:hypothetical protein